MTEIRWSRTARGDLRAIYEYIGRDSIIYAQRMMERFERAGESLTTFPEAGAPVQEWDRHDLREIYVANYRVIYRYTAHADVVDILTVVHSARELPDADSFISE